MTVKSDQIMSMTSASFLHRNVRLAAVFTIGTWIACWAAYLLLPFSFPLKAHNGIIAIMLALTTFTIWPALRAMPSRAYHKSGPSRRARGVPLIVLVGLPATLFLWVDLYLIRGLSLTGEIGINRTQFINSSPSIAGYLSYISCAALLLTLSALPMFSRRLRILVLMVYASAAALLLISGNRQFVTAGLLITYLSYLICSTTPRTRKLIVGFFGAAAFATLALIIQFSRQSFADGEQLEFLVGISKIECHGLLCTTPAVVPAMYLYQYYGTVFIGASFYILQDIHTPAMSTTFPIIYKRISGIFGLPSHQEVVSQALARVESHAGVFPNFWKTMYGHLYSDYGWIGIFVWVIVYRALLARAVCRIMNDLSMDRVATVTVLLAFVIIGVMFTPTTEPIFTVALIMIYARIAWSRIGFMNGR